MSTDDGALLPDGTFEEEVVRPEHLTGEVEGRQLAWLYLPGVTPDWKTMVDVGAPMFWEGLALEFTDGSKLMLFAVPVNEGDYPPYRTIILFRWFEKLTMATRSQIQHLRGYSTQQIVSPIQMEVHGLVIRGASVDPQPNAMGGQNVTIEFAGGTKLRLRAHRRRQAADPNTGQYAMFEVGLVRPSRIVSAGDRGIATDNVIDLFSTRDRRIS